MILLLNSPKVQFVKHPHIRFSPQKMTNLKWVSMKRSIAILTNFPYLLAIVYKHKNIKSVHYSNLSNDHFLCLTKAMAAIETLFLDSWVPGLR